MPIRTVDSTETLTLTVQGTTFRYRMATGDRTFELQERHRNILGTVDEHKLTRDLLAECVVGWSDLHDARGVDIPYSPEAATAILPTLPYYLMRQLQGVILTRVREGSAEGNGSGTS